MPHKEHTPILRVLVVDDNPNIFDDFQAILQEATEPSDLDAMNAELFGGEVKDAAPGRTYQLDYASQGEAGYEKVKQALTREKPYQLAFVDMRMPPGWDGLETIERIWQADPHIQMVICTAYSDYSWEQITKRLGTAPNLLILKKPFDVTEVAQLASALTEKWHLGRQAALKMEELDRKVAERTAELQRLNERLQEEITERTQAEEKAQWFLESVPEAMLIVNDTGKIVLVNAQAERMFGYDREALVAQAIEKLIPERFRRNHAGHREAFFTAPQVRPMGMGLELYGLHKDGSEFPVEVSLSPIEIQGEALASCSIRDVTKRKQAEEALRRSEERFAKAFHASPDLIVITRLSDGSYVDVNESFLRVAGYRRHEVVGRTSIELNRWVDLDDRVAIQRLLGEQGAVRDREVKFRTKSGEIRETQLSLELITLDREPCILAVARDITEHKRMEHQLTQTQKLESIGQLAAGIAHEINTPTQFVSDNTRFLQDAFRDLTTLLEPYTALTQASKAGTVTIAHIDAVEKTAEAIDVDYLTEEIPEAIQQSLEGLDHIATIVRAMKEFSHPGTEEKTVIDLNKAIESTITVARNEWKYAAEIVTDFAPDLPLVPCVPGAFNQAILNMVVNAAHTIAEAVQDRPESKGTITVRTRHDGDWVEVNITDTGTGIPEAVRTKVFEPFFTTKEVGKGTGQGLTIAYDIVVKKHGGTLTFESKEGQGTTFRICLPLGDPALEEENSMISPGALLGPK